MVRLALFPVGNDIVNDLLLVIVVFLRQQNILRAVGNTAPQRNISRVPAHNLNDTASLMGGRCVSYLVNGLHRRIDRRIETDGILCTGNVQINRSRQTDGIDAVSRKSLRAPVGAIPSDHHQTVNSVLMTDFRTPLLSFFRPELMTSRRSQNSAAALNRIRYRPLLHIYDLFIQETLISFLNPLHFDPVSDALSDHRTDRRIHTRRVSPTGQHTDRLNLLRHTDSHTFPLCHVLCLLSS